MLVLVVLGLINSAYAESGGESSLLGVAFLLIEVLIAVPVTGVFFAAVLSTTRYRGIVRRTQQVAWGLKRRVFGYVRRIVGLLFF